MSKRYCFESSSIRLTTPTSEPLRNLATALSYCHNPKNQHERNESERFESHIYKALSKRDKFNLNILTPRFPSRRPLGPARLILRSQRIQVWLKDDSLEDSANLPAPDVIAAEIVEDLEAALSQFATIATDLKK
jgi:type I restriction enzyme M protein